MFLDSLENKKLVHAELNKLEANGVYYLTLTYQGKGGDGYIHEQVVTGIPLKLANDVINYSIDYCDLYSSRGITNIDVGFGDVELRANENIKVIDKIIGYVPPKAKEMTLNEIEMVLGYKVKIINEANKRVTN